MNVLLDSHVFVWLDSNPGMLSNRALGYLQDVNNRLLLSSATVWELGVKIHNGKLSLSDSLEVVVSDQIARNGLLELPITFQHTLAASILPTIHKDPFDRMLIAQAITENAILLTNDSNIHKYPVVRTAW